MVENFFFSCFSLENVKKKKKEKNVLLYNIFSLPFWSEHFTEPTKTF